MKINTLRIAVATAFMALGAASAKAETTHGPMNNTVEVRVINNNAATVRVYVEDAAGHLHQLGRVARSDFKIMQVPADVADMGAFKIKVYPSEPVWSLLGDSDGVKTRGLELKVGDAINFWAETDLRDSKVEILKG